VKLALCAAVESPPTKTSMVVVSITQSLVAAFQYRSSSGPSGKRNVCDSPAARVRRWKPLSSRIGRDADPYLWWM